MPTLYKQTKKHAQHNQRKALERNFPFFKNSKAYNNQVSLFVLFKSFTRVFILVLVNYNIFYTTGNLNSFI